MGLLVALVVLVPLVGALAFHARAYARAAALRAGRRAECPFEDDDDTPRPLRREIADVAVETVAVIWLALRGLLPLPHAWSEPAATPGAPILVLLPERGLGAGSLEPVARGLRHALGSSVQVEPRSNPWASVPDRVGRLADFVDALRAVAPGAAIVLVGHGAGGLVARRHLEESPPGERVAQVVTIAADHGAEPVVPSVPYARVISIYSLHDAIVTPPARAYLAGAFNIAVRDAGHYGIALSPRTTELIAENLNEVGAGPTRSGSLAS